MLRLLLFLRGKLPEHVWRQLRARYWKGFWEREFREEHARVSNAPELPIAGSERATLVEAIVDAWPFRNVLEVGCSYGQNLTIIAPLFAGIGFVGIDSDPERVRQGAESVRIRGIKNVSLSEARVEALEEFADNSFDVVYSCALFLYVEPEIIETAMLEMLRVARSRIFLMEQHVENLDASDEFAAYVSRDSGLGGYWLRDYRRMLERLAPRAQVSVQKIRSPRWPAEQWKELAHLIEVVL